LLRKNRLDLFERKLDDGEDALQKDLEENTPLLAALLQRKPDFVKAILNKRKGEQINEQKTTKGLAPLHVACDKCPEAVPMLLKAGASFDLKDDTESHNLPMHYAAANDFVDAIEALVKAGANVNQPNGDGDLPITFALLNGAVNAIKVLIKHKSDIYHKNNKGSTVWEISQRKDNTVPKQSRVTFMTELDVLDAREFKLMRKFPTQKRVFGKNLSLDWHKATQFAFSVKQKTKVAVLIAYPEVDKKPDFAVKTGFCVVKGDEGIHKEPTFWQGGIGFGGLKPFKGGMFLS
jgi:ankyrin repeat protein